MPDAAAIDWVPASKKRSRSSDVDQNRMLAAKAAAAAFSSKQGSQAQPFTKEAKPDSTKAAQSDAPPTPEPHASAQEPGPQVFLVKREKRNCDKRCAGALASAKATQPLQEGELQQKQVQASCISLGLQVQLPSGIPCNRVELKRSPAKIEKKKSIEELIKERKEREKNNTPEAIAKREAEEIALDAQKLLKEEEEKKKKEEEEKEARSFLGARLIKAAKKKQYLDDIKEALRVVRKLATSPEEDPSGGVLAVCRERERVRLEAGVDQEDIVAASQAPAEEDEETEEQDEPETQSHLRKEKEKELKKITKKEKKKIAKVASAARLHLSQVAAAQAKEEGKSIAEVGKAATQAAKAWGGDPQDIKLAADLLGWCRATVAEANQAERTSKETALKIAKGSLANVGVHSEITVDPKKTEEEESSSSSSSSSSSVEEEEDLGEMDRHKAKMDGMAAIYYWGMGVVQRRKPSAMHLKEADGGGREDVLHPSPTPVTAKDLAESSN
ncbi:hypothetical protein AK812_SmicGene2277 [Symbiodinium microadriaticum]|uniref:Uncharacterized protein n=1 Tax=Symbiodinium microadriaticum TaxID=2951 RepID=A0A1Q9F1R4_SYMMI|nr:hypothetical protein AK812_SmicGene2277 [Symbiodinium microadriaticum]